jgi:hypothetical protein
MPRASRETTFDLFFCIPLSTPDGHYITTMTESEPSHFPDTP